VKSPNTIRLPEGTETLEGIGFHLKIGFIIYLLICLGTIFLLWENSSPEKKKPDSPIKQIVP